MLVVGFGGGIALAPRCASVSPDGTIHEDGRGGALARDSVARVLPDGFAEIEPIARIADPRIDEASGLARLGGAWFTHNDSGDGPFLYRSETLDFAAAERLRVEGADAVDWEEVALWGNDLLVCDMGDNHRERHDVTLYRVQIQAAAKRARGEPSHEAVLRAAYPIRYPDGPQDAEACFVVDDRVYVITKERDERGSQVFVFDALRPREQLASGEANVGGRVGRLALGEQEMVTAADVCLRTRTVWVLTYTQIAAYPLDRLDGAPVRSWRLGARQCEAIVVWGDSLVITNEQRDVFVFDGLTTRDGVIGLVPARQRARIPVLPHPVEIDGQGRAWRAEGAEIPMSGLRAGEHVRWALAGGRLHVSARLRPKPAKTFAPTDGDRAGSGLFLAFGRERAPTLRTSAIGLFLGARPDGSVALFDAEIPARGRVRLTPSDRGVAVGRWDGEVFECEVRLDPARLVSGPFDAPLCFAALVAGMRPSAKRDTPDPTPRFGLADSFALARPYLWAEVTIGD